MASPLPPAHGAAPRRETLALWTLAGIQFTYMLDFTIMMPLGPMFTRTFEVSVQQFGFLISAYTFSGALAGIGAANFIDRFDRRKLILGLYALYLLAALLCGLAPGYASLFLARCIAGAIGGLLAAMVQIWIGELVPFERRGRAMGIVMSAFSISMVAGVPLGLTLAAHLGVRAPFFFLSLLVFVILMVGLRTLPQLERPQRDAHHGRASWFTPMQAVLRVSNHLRAFAFMALLMMSVVMLMPYLPIFMTANLGLAEVHLTWVYLLSGLATLYTARLAGRLADRHGKLRIYRLLALGVMLPTLTLAYLPPVPLWLLLAVTTLMMVLMSGRVIPAMSLITGSMVPAMRGAFTSMNATVQAASTGVGSIVGGFVLTLGADGKLLHFDILAWLSVASGLVAVWLAGRLKILAGAPGKP